MALSRVCDHALSVDGSWHMDVYACEIEIDERRPSLRLTCAVSGSKGIDERKRGEGGGRGRAEEEGGLRRAPLALALPSSSLGFLGSNWFEAQRPCERTSQSGEVSAMVEVETLVEGRGKPKQLSELLRMPTPFAHTLSPEYSAVGFHVSSGGVYVPSGGAKCSCPSNLGLRP